MSNPVPSVSVPAVPLTQQWGDLRQDVISFDPVREPVVLVCGHLLKN